MKCRNTKQGSNCAVLVSSTHHIAESARRESKFSPILSPKSSAIAFTPKPVLPPCMSAMNSVSPALKPKHHACSAHEKNVRMRAYSGVFCVQLLSPRQSSFVPIISSALICCTPAIVAHALHCAQGRKRLRTSFSGSSISAIDASKCSYVSDLSQQQTQTWTLPSYCWAWLSFVLAFVSVISPALANARRRLIFLGVPAVLLRMAKFSAVFARWSMM